MDATAYILWDKIKKQIEKDGNARGSCALSGIADVRAANQLNNAGFIKIESINEYELHYYVEFLDSNGD